MNVVLSITQGLNLITAFSPILLGAALQLKKIIEGSDNGQGFEVQIHTYENGTLKLVDETDQIIKDALAELDAKGKS